MNDYVAILWHIWLHLLLLDWLLPDDFRWFSWLMFSVLLIGKMG